MYQAPRGTNDLLPDFQGYWSLVRSRSESVARTFGYGRIDTPVFESTGLFLRTVGLDTDIVSKEMYSFEDRGEQELTLRPEGTAPVCRAYLEHGMRNLPQPVRLFYTSPMFRYDRPQAGRYRQFHQFGVEAIGDGDPSIDAEIIQLAMTFIESLGLTGCNLVINSIGDAEDRPAYLQAIQKYFSPHLDILSPDDRRRFDANPLRLLDSKEPNIQALLENVPRSTDYLGPTAREHWNQLLSHLKDLNIAYREDHRLVRGLDYYTRTVFEIHPRLEGAQSAICAGGRYDGLIEQLGGSKTPGIGFAAGIERMILNLNQQGIACPPDSFELIVMSYRGNAARSAAFQLAARLRTTGKAVVLAPDRSLKAQMRYASNMNASYVVIIGDLELEKGVATVRNMATGEQLEVPMTGLVEYLTTR